MKEKKYEICHYCDSVCISTEKGKLLCKKDATSILCNENLLHKNSRLTLVEQNESNKYFLVENTNTVILHVESDFCILIDRYSVDWQGNGCELPKMLSTARYYTFQVSSGKEGHTRRDWVKQGATGYIGYDIHKLVYGEAVVNLRRKQGLSLDHMAETYDERLKNTSFNLNPIEKTHRTRVLISSEDELDNFIDDIINNEGVNDGIYYDKKLKKKKKYRSYVK